MATTIGRISISLPVAVDQLNLDILMEDESGGSLIIAKAAKRALQSLFFGVEFDTEHPSAEIVIDIVPLHCPCGGCIGVQTCSED